MDSQQGRYSVDLTVTLDATPASAFAVLTDYPNLPRINPAVVSAETMPGAPAGSTRLATHVRVCVAWFCRDLRQVQDMRASHEHHGGGHVHAEVLPALSDLKFGRADWTVWPCEQQTCLRFATIIEPDFWVPPVIGPWLIKRKLSEEALQTSHGIEAAAHDPGALPAADHAAR